MSKYRVMQLSTNKYDDVTKKLFIWGFRVTSWNKNTIKIQIENEIIVTAGFNFLKTLDFRKFEKFSCDSVSECISTIFGLYHWGDELKN